MTTTPVREPILVALLWTALVGALLQTTVVDARPSPYEPRLVAQRNSLELRAEIVRHRSNEHPLRIDEDRLAVVLQEVQAVDDGAQALLFDEAQAYRVAKALAKALLNASPEQDLLLASFRIEGNFFQQKRYVSTARVFAQNDRLNLIFGTIDEFYSEARDLELEPLIYGSRDSASQTSVLLETPPTIARVDGRSDWLALNLHSPPSQQEGTDSATVSRTQPNAAVAALPPSSGSPVKRVSQRTLSDPPNSKAPSVSTGISEEELVDKLRLLRRLQREELISEEDYETRKTELLDRMMR